MPRASVVPWLVLAACAARAGAELKAADYAPKRAAFRKALEPLAKDLVKDAVKEQVTVRPDQDKSDRLGAEIAEVEKVYAKLRGERVAAVRELVQVRDERVFEDLFKALGPLARQGTRLSPELDKITDRLQKAQKTYFAWIEDEYRRTGTMPTYGLKIHIETVNGLTKEQRLIAGEYGLWIALRKAITDGLGPHLRLLGEERERVWKTAVQLGAGAKDPLDRMAFCETLVHLDGPGVLKLLLELEQKEKDEAVLVPLIRALSAQSAPEAFERVLARVSHVSWPVASAAVRGLVRFRNEKVVPALYERLATADPQGRLFEDVLDALFETTGKHLPETSQAWKAWWEKNRAAFLKRWSAKPEERKAEIEAIGFSNPQEIDVAAELAALLRTEPDRGLRVELVDQLSLQRSQAARNMLLQVLDDPDRTLRIAAVRGLAHYRHVSVPEPLMKLVDGADGEELEAVFLSLRELWGGQDEFTVSKPSKEGLGQWWVTNQKRVANQFLKLGARDVAAGHKPPAEIKGNWQDRNFYGLRIYSKRVLFVVDDSLSMEEPAQEGSDRKKIDVAKEELKRALKSLPEEASFGIIAFAGTPEFWEKGMMKGDAASRKRAEQWIGELGTHPGTNIYDSLEIAFQLGHSGVHTATPGASPDTIYLVSDGNATVGKFLEGEEILRQVSLWNQGRGIRVHAIGVGKDHDVDFLSKLAAMTGGYYVAR